MLSTLSIYNIRLLLPLLAASLLFAPAAPRVFAQTFVPATPEEAGVSSERLARIDAALEAYVEEERLPGAALVIGRRGHVVYAKAFGYRDREAGEPLKITDLFRIASQTKAVISVGVMILQEQGRLLIDQDLGDFIPEFDSTTVAVATEDGGYEVVPADRKITVRGLLTHTAGIGYGWGPGARAWEEAGIVGWYFADRDEPIADTVERMADLPMAGQPGEAYVYGYATDILGVVIERASGLPLDEFLRVEILEPLGMVDTYFYVPPEEADRLTVVYSVTDEKGMERAPNPGHMVGQGMYLKGPRKSFSGGAGLVSTAGDYARFLEALRRGGTLDGARILSPKTVQLMTVDHVHDAWRGDGGGFGLGFGITKEIGWSGLPGSPGAYNWGGAYHSTYWVDPEEELVVSYMTQVIPAQGLDDHQRIRALVYQALVD
ncbi:MAG: serine hydrolase [candidate division Zixibacteria bacterium]|nr:serine hydrolase [candidate division Zixibacteria bacterium]